MKNLIDLSGKHILVIGASSGIGREVAIIASEVGAIVSIVARREKELKKTNELMHVDSNQYFVFDIADTTNISLLINNITKEKGKIDGLVYTCGIGDLYPLKTLNKDRMESFFNTNYFGFIEVVKCVSEKRNYNKGMRIVAISSASAIRGKKAHSIYAGTKGAMDASVRCLAQELAPKGISINSVAPGMTNTEMYDRYLIQSGEQRNSNNNLPNQLCGVLDPIDVANAVVFLLSDSARAITGVTLPVDGGLTALL